MMQAGVAQELSPANDKGQYRYWVKFGDDGLIQRLGGHQALKQAAVSRSAQFTSEQQRMQQQQAAMLQTIAAELGHDLQVSHHFLVTQNAIGALLTAKKRPALPVCRAWLQLNESVLINCMIFVAPSLLVQVRYGWVCNARWVGSAR